MDTLILTESELNQWSEERLKFPEPEEEDLGWTDTFRLEVGPVNFRILENRLQLATEVQLAGLAPDSTFIYQVTGRFESAPGGVRFMPESGNLGQAPFGSVPVTREWLFSLIRTRYERIEEIAWLVDALDDLEAIEISDGQLTLRRKAQG